MRAAFVLTLVLAGTASARPPADVREAAAPLGCSTLTWTAWKGGWWADCTRTEPTRRDGDEVVHRYVAFRRRAGRVVMDDIVETRDRSSPRIKVPRRETVTLRDGRAIYEARTDAGHVHRRIWDLATARLIEDRDGGGTLCADGPAKLERPVCVTDFVRPRQRCTAPRPVCTRAPIKLESVAYTAIPLHAAAAPLRDPDLFGCATTIGERPEDVASGKRGATFQIVAVDDDQTLALHLRAAAPRPGDHWELRLASQANELTCEDAADLDRYCREAEARVLEVAIAAGTVKPITPAPPAGWERELRVRTDGDLIVELDGALRAWAHQAITVAYVDATGARSATSRADSLGRIGNTLLCDR